MYLTCVNNAAFTELTDWLKNIHIKNIYLKAVEQNLACLAQIYKIVGGRLLTNDNCLHMQSINFVYWKPRMER